ncbi:MAG: cell division protein FtsQ/DivIB [Planctomycetota bacterium]|jgi:hypothetical protein
MFRAIPKAAILSMVGPMALLLAGYLGWRFYGAKALDAAYYAVKQENIHISDRPPWLKSDVVAEVFEQNGLGRMSLLDDLTAAVIAKAFDGHPWVKKTHRVHRMAGGQIMINAEFRQPVAMVHCDPDPSSDSGGAGQESFLPVDGEGILLPTKDFSQEDIPDYMLIYAQNIRASDYPRVGMIMADPQISEAILLCRFLGPLRSHGLSKLSSVYVYPNTGGGKSRWKLELTTKGGPRIMWGSAPTHESSNEPTANVKLKRLAELIGDSAQWAQAEVDLTVTR